MPARFVNNFNAPIAASLSSTDTIIPMASGFGAVLTTKLGAPLGADYMYATLVNAANDIEIVKVTEISGDNLTVVRGVDNTIARSWAVGDRISFRLNAAALTDGRGVANGLATLDSSARLPVAQMPAGSICQVATVQTRTNAAYSAPTLGNGTEIILLNISITPRKAGNIMILEWTVMGEVHQDVVFLVARNGLLLPNATNTSNNRWAGIVPALYDFNNDSTPSVHVVRIVDYSTLATASTYSLLVRSSSGTAYTLYLNRTIASFGVDGYEAGLSSAIAMEVMQ